MLVGILLASMCSCGPGENGNLVVTSPRQGGAEVDPPSGGFRAKSGQTLYVPAYSSIFTADDSRPFNLAVTLSVRNTDRDHAIVITSVRYFDHNGKLIHDYQKRPLRVGPMAAVEFFVKERDTSGGISASFLVEWLAEEVVSAPIVESVMVGTASAQGLSFTSPGRVVADRREPAPASGDTNLKK